MFIHLSKTQKVSECLRANRKEVAMTHLKSRKLYEELLRKRLGSLEVLQSTLIHVETAAQDVEVIPISYTKSILFYSADAGTALSDYETIRVFYRDTPQYPFSPLPSTR